MRVLLYGNGWIGSMFTQLCEERGWEIITGGRVDDYPNVWEEINEVRPNRVVCMIGRTHGPGYKNIDYLEQKGKLVENIRDNLYAPLILANICMCLSIHLTYLGTGCIFTYDDTKRVFREDDLPNFFASSYSTVKGFTDRLMHDLFDGQVLNVRIRMPIHSSPHERNFIDKIISYKKICSIPNSMSVLDELLPVLIEEIENESIGTFNLCNPGVITHNEILEMYKEMIDPEHTWENFTYEEQMDILSAGRSNNELDCTRLVGRVSNIKDAVKKCLEKYKEEKSKCEPLSPRY